jgi:hypothetical protein
MQCLQSVRLKTYQHPIDMNANELADDAKNICNAIEALEWVQKAVPMLRQQQAEIEALKKTISSLFGGLEASLNLNKAQAIRKATDA